MSKRGLLTVFLVFLVGLVPIFFLERPAAAATTPAGFEDRLVVDVSNPTAMAFTPNKRLLIGTKNGQVRLYKDGASGTSQALDISKKVCSNSERGLLGIAVDPNFASNQYVYVYYTYNKYKVCPHHKPARKDNPVNRVSRFKMNGDNLVRSSEKVLITNIPSPNGNHNAGDLNFGKDGYLYVSVGDGACDYAQPQNCQPANDASRDRNVLLGKILRIKKDGGIPATNPYTGSNSARCGVPAANGRTSPGKICKETFAWGLRNPFRMAFDPDASGTSFRINDVGGANREEIDPGRRGADYGWNCKEGTLVNSRTGKCDPMPKTVNPIHQYSHKTNCSSITGAAFVPDGFWPSSYDKAYLFGDYVCGKIFKLTPKSGGGFTRTNFATKLGQGGPIDMTFGPYKASKALYYTTFAGGAGQIRRIAYTAGNRTPNAAVSADPAFSANVPMDVTFDASKSTDPDKDNLAYEWDFTNDGTVDATGATASHTYETKGTYTATLTVKDEKGLSDTTEIRIDAGNTPPMPKIESPTPDKTFRVGEKITLQGSATDPEDGAVPDDKLTWKVVRHHNGSHTHPYAEGIGNNRIFTAPAPEDLFATNPKGNYLEIQLTATDEQGLKKTVSQRLNPKVVGVRMVTRPTALRLKINGRTIVAPKTLKSWEGYKLNVYAPRQRKNGRLCLFRSWSDGRGARHTIVTPAEPKKYIARFRLRR